MIKQINVKSNGAVALGSINIVRSSFSMQKITAGL